MVSIPPPFKDPGGGSLPPPPQPVGSFATQVSYDSVDRSREGFPVQQLDHTFAAGMSTTQGLDYRAIDQSDGMASRPEYLDAFGTGGLQREGAQAMQDDAFGTRGLNRDSMHMRQGDAYGSGSPNRDSMYMRQEDAPAFQPRPGDDAVPSPAAAEPSGRRWQRPPSGHLEGSLGGANAGVAVNAPMATVPLDSQGALPGGLSPSRFVPISPSGVPVSRSPPQSGTISYQCGQQPDSRSGSPTVGYAPAPRGPRGGDSPQAAPVVPRSFGGLDSVHGGPVPSGHLSGGLHSSLPPGAMSGGLQQSQSPYASLPQAAMSGGLQPQGMGSPGGRALQSQSLSPGANSGSRGQSPNSNSASFAAGGGSPQAAAVPPPRSFGGPETVQGMQGGSPAQRAYQSQSVPPGSPSQRALQGQQSQPTSYMPGHGLARSQSPGVRAYQSQQSLSQSLSPGVLSPGAISGSRSSVSPPAHGMPPTAGGPMM